MASHLTSVVDTILDKTLVPGYSSIGPALRRRWWAADPDPQALVGRHVVVTGGSSGLGRAAATGIARLGGIVHLVGRNADRLQESAELIRRDVPDAQLLEEVSDISDLDSVRAYAAKLAKDVPALHAIVHDAGVMPPERTETAQGHELALATHVIGPVLLTELLRESLTAADSPRVVIVSSGGMYSAPLDASIGDDIEYERGTYEGIRAYARTKRIQVTMTELLARRYAADGIVVHSMHPGWAATPGVTESMPRFAKVLAPILRTAEDGADTIVWLTASGLATRTSGQFWSDRRARSTYYLPRTSDDADARRSVWGYVLDAAGIDHAPA
ncbi:SDR family NAD(P)-dependent oxidoreductase [Aeromicrobium fastidiosum]|uniref:SDR family NAD(P)-dependent oxidoreductase n=1 Tax=Aeromicrobium fastidiosum TaxID=52699 RepID=A0A641AL04_9ACTN|nr:SDR family NAD(P)-dependent oxidoreductase [Aeromicrobium fastidiosum]KAA1376521.1 SDR family NAD(P)-dependent oxidoreductase [Aeromicrobium fastidiosum]MBP2391562.1 NAD(P)-dependent dehydrogenase (short-subunit alcohol dehydrogenase family) [Aeromicrobium fastidiosum]